MTQSLGSMNKHETNDETKGRISSKVDKNAFIIPIRQARHISNNLKETK